MKWHFSDYLTVVAREKDYALAQGTTGAILKVDKKIFDELSQSINRKSSKKVEFWKKKLKENLILVPFGLDERNIILERNKLETDFAVKTCPYSQCYLFLTLRCNLSCAYCFENEKKLDMDIPIAEASLMYFLEKARQAKTKKFRVTFFGGEPLLNLTVLEAAVKFARNYCQNYGLKPVFSIITNGVLFNEKVAAIFEKEKDLESVQVTLDGLKQYHDRRRKFKNGQGTYDLIMANLPLIARTAKRVNLRISIDKDNYAVIPEWIKTELSGFLKKNFEYFLAPLNNLPLGKGCGWQCAFPLDESPEKLETLKKKMNAKLGAKHSPQTFFPLTRYFHCAASLGLPVWVSPKGELSLCLVYPDKHTIGNVFEGIKREKLKFWEKFTLPRRDECLKCKAVFFCGGPCVPLFSTPELKKQFCQKTLNGLKRHLKEMK